MDYWLELSLIEEIRHLLGHAANYLGCVSFISALVCAYFGHCLCILVLTQANKF